MSSRCTTQGSWEQEIRAIRPKLLKYSNVSIFRKKKDEIEIEWIQAMKIFWLQLMTYQNFEKKVDSSDFHR